jgi:hypothetical protein
MTVSLRIRYKERYGCSLPLEVLYTLYLSFGQLDISGLSSYQPSSKVRAILFLCVFLPATHDTLLITICSRSDMDLSP